MDLIVKYNGTTITPTPLVSRNFQFLDYGKRWGNIQEITLNGFLTGITTGNVASNVASITNIFTGQFGTLTVLEGANTIFSWNNMYLEDIAFPENNFFQQSFAPYSVKMHRYNVPSGVINPVNEYSFSQGEDGIVTVNHKVSANGVKSTNGALTNVIAFVKFFTGKNPFDAAFIPSGQGILTSISESIDRSTCSYSVSETYKYNTGVSQNYIEFFSADIGEIIDSEFLTLDAMLKIQGSPVNNNLITIESSLGTLSMISKVSGLGIDTTKLMRSNSSISRDSGAAVIEIKNTYLSGVNISDISGFFDYSVELEKDLVLPKETWKLEGEFVCNGPLNYQLQRLVAFKLANGSDWKNYCNTLINTSPLYSGYHTATISGSNRGMLDIQENSGHAQFKMTYSTIEGACESGVTNPKYTVEVNPRKWSYDLMASSNIEGHYVVQDLQMMTQGKININVMADAQDVLLSTNLVSGYIAELEAIYIQSGQIIAENFVTGILDTSYNREWLGIDNLSLGFTSTKVVGSTVANYTRQGGYRFGY